MNLNLFIPCSIGQFSPQTGKNLIDLLNKLGHKVNYNPEITCCGRILYDNGNWEEAKEIGEKFILSYPINDYIVGCSTNCIGYIKNDMGKLFFNTSLHNIYKNISKNIMDINEFLVNYSHNIDLGAYFPFKVAIHYNCRSLNEYNLEEEIKLLLENVRGIDIIKNDNNNFCCGYGGLFTVYNEAISIALAKANVEKALNQGAEYIVGSDLSCLLHMKSYIDKNKINLKIIHIVDLLMWDENQIEENTQI